MSATGTQGVQLSPGRPSSLHCPGVQLDHVRRFIPGVALVLLAVGCQTASGSGRAGAPIAVLQIAPPLISTAEQLDEMARLLREVLADAGRFMGLG